MKRRSKRENRTAQQVHSASCANQTMNLFERVFNATHQRAMTVDERKYFQLQLITKKIEKDRSG